MTGLSVTGSLLSVTEAVDVELLGAAELWDRVALLAPRFRALADENRLALALLLSQRPHTVKELQEATGLSQTLVSHHLGPLRELGMVTMTPRGRSNVYSFCCGEVTTMVQWLATLAATQPPSQC